MQNSDLGFVEPLKENPSVCSRMAVSGDTVKGEWKPIMKEVPASDAVRFFLFVRSSSYVTATSEFTFSTPSAQFFSSFCQSGRVAWDLVSFNPGGHWGHRSPLSRQLQVHTSLSQSEVSV